MKLLKVLVAFTALWLGSCATSSQPIQCEVSGCNQEICSEKGKKMISPCVILPQHECLRKTQCEVQSSGKCGWTQNEEYRNCLKRFVNK